MAHPFTLTLLIASALASCAAVGQGRLPVPAPGSSTGASGTAVTFAIAVDAGAFSAHRQISVRIYDADQLKVLDETQGCSVSHDVATGQDRVSCPPGVTYRAPQPEERFVSKEELAAGLTIPSSTVTVGERYRVSISGQASDDCNTASATADGVAGSPAVRLANLPVAQTEMGCQPQR